MKLRGEWSEGIIVKPEQVDAILIEKSDCVQAEDEGRDVSDDLGIKHYEPPLPQDLSAKGLLPLGIPKTDEERWENIAERLPIGEVVDVTLKIDGQSWTAYYDIETDMFGVCGRTLEFKGDAHNKYTAHIERYDIREKLIAYCKANEVSLAIRGESYGQGIQAFGENPHSKENSGLAIFSVWLIKERMYARKGHQFYFPLVANALDIPHVPIIEQDAILTQELIEKYSIGIKKIDGKSFEGVVINHDAYSISRPLDDVVLPDGTIKKLKDAMTRYAPGSFKVINKDYDMNK